MYIIEVIPLTLLPQNTPQVLSYFFNRVLSQGTVVEITIGSREINAAVISSSSLEKQKISLKESSFQLKKLNKVINENPQVGVIQFKIATWLSQHYYAPLGYCLKTVLPPFIGKRDYKLRVTNYGFNLQSKIHSKLILITRAKDTLNNLEPFIKRVVKDSGQILLVLPDITTMDYFFENLSSKYSSTKVYSKISNKNLFKIWQNVSTGKVQIIIGTRQALFLPFQNLKLVIFDDPLHEAYKSDMTPKYNAPDLAEKITELYRSAIIFTSPISGVNNYYKSRDKKLEILNKVKNSSQIKIVDIIDEIRSGNFSIFSQELKLKILETIKNRGRILIFSPRRGHSGILVCQNCGLAIKCPNCDTPMRIHKTTELILACHRCGKISKFPNYCLNCNSYKLKTVGPAGTQKVYDEIQRLLDFNHIKIPVLILDTDVVKNETEEEEIMSGTDIGPSILIATQMIFSHRYTHKFNLIGILNTDLLASSPDFKSEERLIYDIEKIYDFEAEQILIQAYNSEYISRIIGTQNYNRFYEEELTIRKVLSYPPFSHLVKLIYKHKDRQKAAYMARLTTEKLKMAVAQLRLVDKIKLIEASPAFIEKERGLYIYNMVIKISPELENIRDILKFVPPNWIIDVDPSRLL